MFHVEVSKFVGTTRDHLDAFVRYSEHTVAQIDISSFKRGDFDLSAFDCVVFHHSIPIGIGNYVDDDFAFKINKFSGLKALFIQDEMRWVASTCEKIEKLGISLIFTVANKEVVRQIYREPWFNTVRFEHVLTGYVPEHLLNQDLPRYEDREVDVSYRARRLPAWCGEFGQEKSRIARRFSDDAVRFGLNCDISCNERDRIYGNEWLYFIKNSKAMLGAESGASFIDYSGHIAPAVDEFERQNPNVPFEEVRDRFLEGRDGQTVIKVISPRCFEAAALKTLMVMYEGSYSGVLEAGKHYVPLARDHSNMGEVVDIIRSPRKAETIIEAAYNEVACSGRWSYAALVKQFDKVITEDWKKLGVELTREISTGDLRTLVKQSNRLTRWNNVKFKIAMFLAARSEAYLSFIHNHCPVFVVEFFHRPLLSIAKHLKPLLKRILLG